MTQIIGIPDELEYDAISSAREIVGRGYVDGWYAEIASNFVWLYECGVKDGRKAAQATARKRRAAAKRRAARA